MKHISKIALSVLAAVLLAGLASVVPGFRPPAELRAAAQTISTGNVHNVFTVDLAVDCRTVVTGPNRGDLFIINGKIFPAGTLPSGTALNDPTQPVNGVAPIGEWLVRGHHAFPFPPAIAPSYGSTPGDFGTTYFILDGGRSALITETYAFLQGQAPSVAYSAITGGTGRFRGAAGDIPGGAPLGTNATGCPNFRTTFNFVPGSVRRASNN
jgi:hypothetical protein